MCAEPTTSAGPVRLWHDDVRPAPDATWTWARTNDAAKAILDARPVTEISLDHDLGYDGPPPGKCEACGGKGTEGNDDEYHCRDCDGDGFIGGDVLYIAGTAEETGHDLVRWMVEHGKVPPKVTVHSWNPDGARRMAKYLQDHGHPCAVAPYDIRTFSQPTRARIARSFGFGEGVA